MKASFYMLLAAILCGVLSESVWFIPLIVLFAILTVRDIWPANVVLFGSVATDDIDYEADRVAARVAQIRKALQD